MIDAMEYMTALFIYIHMTLNDLILLRDVSCFGLDMIHAVFLVDEDLVEASAEFLLGLFWQPQHQISTGLW